MDRPQHALSVARDKPMLSRRAFRIGSVATLHIVAIWAVTHSLAAFHVFEPEKILMANIVEAKPDVPPPPIIVPKMVQPPQSQLTVSAPDIVVETETPPPISVTVGPPAPTPPVSSVGPSDTGPVPTVMSQPPYSAQARRANEEGTVTLHLVVSESGYVVSAEIVKSSGFPDLDKAAASWAIAHWKFRPAIQGGQAVASSKLQNVEFKGI